MISAEPKISQIGSRVTLFRDPLTYRYANLTEASALCAQDSESRWKWEHAKKASLLHV